MEKVIEILEMTGPIYDSKLDRAIEVIKDMEVTDENFNKMLDTLTSLISLKLQRENFIEEYKSRQIEVETKEEI